MMGRTNRMRTWARRACAWLVLAGLLAGSLPAQPPARAAGVPDGIAAALAAPFVEVDGTAQLTVTDGAGNPLEGAELAFTSGDENIAQVDASGTVRGVGIGRVEIQVRADFGGEVRETRAELPVVGKSQMIRNGKNSGVFEDAQAGAPYGSSLDKYWSIGRGFSKEKDGTYRAYVPNTVVEGASALNPSAKLLKFTSDLKDFKNVDVGSGVKADVSSVRISFNSVATEWNGVDQRGAVRWSAAEPKLYEVSGWARAEDVEVPPSGLRLRMYASAYNEASQKWVSALQPMTNDSAAFLWQDAEAGWTQQPWTYFTSAAVAYDGLEQDLLVYPAIEYSTATTSASAQAFLGSLYFADLSFHEVRYDKLVLEAESGVDALAVGASASTTVRHLSTTGQEIAYYAKGAGYDSYTAGSFGKKEQVPVRYESSDPAVAEVSADGVITAKSAGSATITATATLAGVTRTGELAVTVAGDGSEPSGEVSFLFADGIASSTQLTDVKLGEGGRLWGYAGHDTAINASSLSNPEKRLRIVGYGIQMQANAAGQWAAVQFRVPKAGTYALRYDYAQAGGGGQGDLFFLPGSLLAADGQGQVDQTATNANIAAAIQAGTPLAQVDYYKDLTGVDVSGTNGVYYASMDAGTVTVPEAGIYLLAFRSAGKTIYPRGLALTEAQAADALKSVELTLTPASAAAGESAQAAVRGTMASGAAADLSAAQVRYESLNTGVAEIDALSGALTAKSAGSAEITVSVTLDGVTCTDQKTFTVTEKALEMSILFAEGVSGGTTLTDVKLADEGAEGLRWGYAAHDPSIINTSKPLADQKKYLRVLGYGIQMQTAASGQWAAVQFRVPEAGAYALRYDYAQYTMGGPGEVYFLPGSLIKGSAAETNAAIVAAMDASAPAASVDYYHNLEGVETTNGVYYTSVDAAAVNVPTPGVYLMVFRSLGKSMYARGFAMTRTGPCADALESVELTLTPASAAVGGSAQATVRGTMASGAAADLTGAQVRYESLNTEVAEIDALSGALVAKAEGSAEITVSVTLDGATCTDSKSFTVAPPLPAAEFLLDFSQLTSELKDGKHQITGYGNANFTVNRAESNVSSHRVYGPANNAVWTFSAPHIAMGPSTADWTLEPGDIAKRFTVDFELPAGGVYAAEITGGLYFAGGIADVFVDGQYLGDYDFCDYDESKTAPRTLGETKALRTVELAAGAHKLTLRTRGGSVHTTAYFIPYQIRFRPVSEKPALAQVTGTMDKASLAVNESQELTATAQMSDGAAYDFGFMDDGQPETSAQVRVESSNPQVLEVAEPVLREAGKASVIRAAVTAKAEGSVNLTVSVTVDGVEKSTVLPVTVEGVDALASVALALANTEIYDDGSTSASVTGTMTNSGAADLQNAEITYGSSAPEVAEIDAKSGRITARSAGTAEITVSVTLDGVTRTDTKTLTVKANLPYAGENFTIDFKEGQTQSAPIQGIELGKNGSKWGYAGHDPSIVKPNYTEEQKKKLMRVLAYGIQLQTGASGQWVALQIEVPKEGRYFIQYDYARYTGGSEGEVYFLPGSLLGASQEETNANIVAAMDAQPPLTVIDYYHDMKGVEAINGVYYDSAPAGTVNVPEAGVYLIVFRSLGKNMYPRGVTFYGNDVKSFHSVELDVPERVYRGTPGQAVATGRYLDGTEIPMDQAEVVFTSSDPQAATVDARTGLIQAQGPGRATIQVQITFQGKTLAAQKEIRSFGERSLASVSFSEASMKILLGDSLKLTPVGTMNDGDPADLGGYQLSYESQNPSVVSVDGQGMITALAVGQAVITVTAAKGGEQASGSMEVTVVEEAEGFQLKFSSVTTELIDGRHQITDYGDAGFVVDMDKSNTRTHRLFAPGTAGDVRLLHVLVGAKDESWLSAPDNMATRFTVRFQAPYTGRYDIRFRGGKWYAGNVADIFLDDQFLGDYDFCDGDTSFTSLRMLGEDKALNSVYLTAGEHELSFRARGRSVYNSAYVLLDRMTFTPSSGSLALAEIESSLEERLMAGEEREASFIARRENRSAVHFGVTDAGAADTENRMELANSKPEVLAVDSFAADVPGRSGAGILRLRALTPGSTQLTVTAVVDGVEKTLVLPVTVTDEKLAAAGARLSVEEIHVGESAELIAAHILDSGRVTATPAIETTYTSLTPGVAAVDGNRLSARSAGVAKIQVTASFGGVTVSSVVEITVSPEYLAGLRITAGGSQVIKLGGEPAPLLVTPLSNTGSEMDSEGAQISWQALTPEIAQIDADGYIIAHKEGVARFSAGVTLGDRSVTGEAELSVRAGKTEPTIVTNAERQNARANIAQYDWARSEVNAIVKRAERYLNMDDKLWGLVHSEGVPRSMVVGIQHDPKLYYCRYCDTDLLARHGSYAWLTDPLNRPWKVQCPACRRYFPSNDFEGFYQLGLNEYGEFSAERAHLKNDELVAAGQDGYLKNVLYPEAEKKFGDPNWGVDDGFGYLPGRNLANGNPERHTYIGVYSHWGLWYWTNNNPGIIPMALQDLGYAYAYTGEAKYGRAGAILMDRVADMYPGFDLYPYKDITWNSQGGTGRGLILGNIWETGLATYLAESYDLLYPAFDDAYVVNYLNKKSEQVKMRHSKENATMIRNNIEDGILRTIYKGVCNSSISGNFGYYQKTIATAAVALDSLPETGEWLDWMMAEGNRGDVPCTGGNVGIQIVNVVDRDGQGNEASAYNRGWVSSLIEIADVLAGDETYPSVDLYRHPKMRNMIESNTKVLASTLLLAPDWRLGFHRLRRALDHPECGGPGLRPVRRPGVRTVSLRAQRQALPGAAPRHHGGGPGAARPGGGAGNRGARAAQSGKRDDDRFRLRDHQGRGLLRRDPRRQHVQQPAQFLDVLRQERGPRAPGYAEPGSGCVWPQHGAGSGISGDHRHPAQSPPVDQQYPVAQHGGGGSEEAGEHGV